MREEEKETIEYLKARLYGNEGCELIDVAQSDLRIIIKLVDRVLKADKNWQEIYDEQEENIREKNNKICEFEFIIEKQQKELNNLKEIEKSHKEENGKLRVELEQVERKVEEYRIGWCNTGEELEREKERNELFVASGNNINLERHIKNNYISKDKIKEKIEETNNEKLNYSEDEYYLENEIKGYAIDKLKELLEEK